MDPRPLLPRPAGPVLVALALLAAGAAGYLLLEPREGDAGRPVDWGPLRLGADAGGLDDLRAAGAEPAFASAWAGQWSVEEDFRSLRAAVEESQRRGITPVILWYYWGGDLSRRNVEEGANGKSRDDWFATARALAGVLAEATKSKPTLVVLETEFNLPDIVGWQAFDADLAAQAEVFRSASPYLRTVLGFGSWNPEGWETFPQAVAAVDILGFQLMRSPERDGEVGMRGAHLAALDAARQLHDRWPDKPLLLHDLALSTWGSPEGDALQALALSRVLDERGALRAFGCIGILYRGVRDYPDAPPGYYGEGEKHFGLLRADGTPKAAWGPWLEGFKQNP